MSKKLLAGLVVVGGGVWYYDQNIHPIFSQNEKIQHDIKVAQAKAAPADSTTRELRKLDSKARDFGSQLKTTAAKSTEDIRKKTDSAIENVKDTDVYKKWSKKLDSYGEDVRLAAEEVENKPVGHRWAAKYIDFVNGLGQTEDEKLKELASSNTIKQRKIRDDLTRSKQTWGEWWSGKKSEVDSKAEQAKRDAEKTKDSWFSWGQQKKDEAEKNVKSTKKDLEKEKDGWLNWGQEKKDELHSKAKGAKKDLENEKDGWLNWGQEKKDELHSKAQSAKKDAQKEKDGWLNWGQEKKDEAAAQAKDAKNDWSSTLESGKQKALDEYYRAKKHLEDLTKQASEKTSNVLGNDNKRAEINPDDRYLTKAKDDLQNAISNLGKYGGDLVDQADRAIRGKN